MFSALFGKKDAKKTQEDYIEYSGEYKFYVEPTIRGEFPYQTSTILISCYKSKLKQTPISFTCKWFRCIGSKNYELKKVTKGFYEITPYDIGTFIKVAIKSFQSGYEGLSIIRFGPIRMDPCLKPKLERLLSSCQGEFRMNLLRYGQLDIDDRSDFGNRIVFETTQLTLLFNEYFKPEISDFSIDLTATRGIRLKCVNREPRHVYIYFKKGEEEPVSNSILKGDQKPFLMKYGKSLGSSLWDDFSNNTEQDGGQEGKPGAQPDDPGLKQSGVSSKMDITQKKCIILLESDEDSATHAPGSLEEVAVRFETRIARDTFLMTMRMMRLRRSLPLSEVISNEDLLLKRVWYPVKGSSRSPEYFSNIFRLASRRDVLENMLVIHRNLVLENDGLCDGVDILEADLQFAVQEFGGLIDQLKKMKTGSRQALETLDQVEKSIMGMNNLGGKKRSKKSSDKKGENLAEKAKNGASGEGSGKKKRVFESMEVKEMRKKLKARELFNQMLLQEIEKLKKDKSKAQRRAGARRAENLDLSFQQSSTKQNQSDTEYGLLGLENSGKRKNAMERERLNRSVLPKTQESDYLIGKEDEVLASQKKVTRKLEESNPELGAFSPSSSPRNDLLIDPNNPDQLIATKNQKSKENDDEDQLILSSEIKLIKRRLAAHEKAYQEMLDLADRVKIGEPLEEVTEIGDLVGEITAGQNRNPNHISLAQIDDYCSFLRKRMAEIEKENSSQNILAGMERFVKGGSQAVVKRKTKNERLRENQQLVKRYNEETVKKEKLEKKIAVDDSKIQELQAELKRLVDSVQKEVNLQQDMESRVGQMREELVRLEQENEEMAKLEKGYQEADLIFGSDDDDGAAKEGAEGPGGTGRGKGGGLGDNSLDRIFGDEGLATDRVVVGEDEEDPFNPFATSNIYDEPDLFEKLAGRGGIETDRNQKDEAIGAAYGRERRASGGGNGILKWNSEVKLGFSVPVFEDEKSDKNEHSGKDQKQLGGNEGGLGGVKTQEEDPSLILQLLPKDIQKRREGSKKITNAIQSALEIKKSDNKSNKDPKGGLSASIGPIQSTTISQANIDSSTLKYSQSTFNLPSVVPDMNNNANFGSQSSKDQVFDLMSQEVNPLDYLRREDDEEEESDQLNAPGGQSPILKLSEIGKSQKVDLLDFGGIEGDNSHQNDVGTPQKNQIDAEYEDRELYQTPVYFEGKQEENEYLEEVDQFNRGDNNLSAGLAGAGGQMKHPIQLFMEMEASGVKDDST